MTGNRNTIQTTNVAFSGLLHDSFFRAYVVTALINPWLQLSAFHITVYMFATSKKSAMCPDNVYS